MFDIKVGSKVRLQVKSKNSPSNTPVYTVMEIYYDDKCSLYSKEAVVKTLHNISTEDIYLVLEKMTTGQMINFFEYLPDEYQNVRSFNTIFHQSILLGLKNSCYVPLEGSLKVKFLERVSSRCHLLEIDGKEIVHEIADTFALFNTHLYEV